MAALLALIHTTMRLKNTRVMCWTTLGRYMALGLNFNPQCVSGREKFLKLEEHAEDLRRYLQPQPR